MKIGLGCDYGGYNLKKEIISYLESKGIECVDYGINNVIDFVDYFVYGEIVVNLVINKEVDYGILCCGIGIGIFLVVNKVFGIRCVVVLDVFFVKMLKVYNDVNMLLLGERVLGKGLVFEIVEVWINMDFEGDRYVRRVNMIKLIEEKYNK